MTQFFRLASSLFCAGATVLSVAAAGRAANLTISSAIVSANGSAVTLTIPGAAGGLSPSQARGFTICANGVPVKTSAAAMAGGTGTLTLGTPIVRYAIVTLKYDPAAAGAPPLTDNAGNTVGYVANMRVSNGSAVNPSLNLYAPAVSADGLSITATIQGGSGAYKLAPEIAGGWSPYGFDVLAGPGAGQPVAVTSASVSGSALTLRLSGRIWAGAPVRLAYRNPGVAGIVDAASPPNTLGSWGPSGVYNYSAVAANTFLDTFGGSPASSLLVHKPDVGAGWSVVNGGAPWTITTVGANNYAHDAAARVGAAVMQPLPSPASGNYRVTTDAYLKTLAGTITLYCRYSGASGYLATFNPAAGTVTFSKLGAGLPRSTVTTYKLPAACAAGQTYTFSMSCSNVFLHDSRGGSSVGSYTVNAGGGGYSTGNAVSVTSDGSGGSGASATAVASRGSLTDVTPSAFGSGYLTPPAVTVIGGSGAAVSANLTPGAPGTVITICLAPGSKQTPGTPVLRIEDDTAPIQNTGAAAISTLNSSPSQGIWAANFRIDYALDGGPSLQPQNQYLASWSDGAYNNGYTTFSATLNSLPALGGVPPYTYKLYRATGLTASGPVNAAMAHDFGPNPSSLIYIDSPPYADTPYYYYYEVTDATGAVAYANQNGERQYVPVRRGAPLDLYHIGDSITTSGLFYVTELPILMHANGIRTVNGLTELSTTMMPPSTYWSGKSGASTYSWLPGTPYLTAAEANIKANHCAVVSIMLGANDSRDGQAFDSFLTPAIYGANLRAICADIQAQCPSVKKFVLQYPIGSVAWSNGGGNIWQPESASRVLDYSAQIDLIANGQTIFAGNNSLDALLEENPMLSQDGVHPSGAPTASLYSGAQWLGFCWGAAIAAALYPPAPQSSGTTRGSRVAVAAENAEPPAAKTVAASPVSATIAAPAGGADSGVIKLEPRSAPAFGLAKPYNIVTLGGLTLKGSVVEGRIASAGSALLMDCDIASRESSGAGLAVAGVTRTGQGHVHAAVVSGGDASLFAPEVDGGVSGGAGVFFAQYGKVDGDVTYGGAYNPGTTEVTGTAAAGTVRLPIDFTAARTALEALASRCASLPATGETRRNADGIVLSGAREDLNVFTLSADQLDGAATLTLKAPEGSTALVNVSGGKVALGSLRVVLKGIDTRRVLFNFAGAAAVHLTKAEILGGVLAPNAAVTVDDSRVDGTLIAGSLAGTGHFNDYPFEGDLSGETQAGAR